MGFPRQEDCSGLPFPRPEDLPRPGMEPASPAVAGGLFTPSATREVPTLKLRMKPNALLKFCSFGKTKPSAVLTDSCSLKVILLQHKRRGWRGTTIHRDFLSFFLLCSFIDSPDGFFTSLSYSRSSINLPSQGHPP